MAAQPSDGPSDGELLAYLDETLPVTQASGVETLLRDSPALQQRAAALLRNRDRGAHTLADIWRRHRLSCPGRDELGAWLLGAMPPERIASVELHVETLRCRWCRAEVDGLIAAQSESDEATTRRERVFESSVGGRRPGR